MDWALAVTVRYLLAVRAFGVLGGRARRTPVAVHAAARRSQDETERVITVNYSTTYLSFNAITTMNESAS